MQHQKLPQLRHAGAAWIVLPCWPRRCCMCSSCSPSCCACPRAISPAPAAWRSMSSTTSRARPLWATARTPPPRRRPRLRPRHRPRPGRNNRLRSRNRRPPSRRPSRFPTSPTRPR
ncbi:hypothetical protein DKG75_19320 [Zavarzinia compransoris]|uniref:Uncharacterized protein n=1 Tax=Zavarzinia compransoris TaxID=1264899 RepID=A0A317DWL4_9PROT|nr:hypothetical protein DKG75_19320 [Zavarzinia compransoris]